MQRVQAGVQDETRTRNAHGGAPSKTQLPKLQMPRMLRDTPYLFTKIS